MLDPVITPSGHSYERTALEHYLRTVKGEDPQTRKTISVSDLTPNIALKEAIREFLADNPWAHPSLPRDASGQVSVTGVGPGGSA